jgi:hypothetical protein
VRSIARNQRQTLSNLRNFTPLRLAQALLQKRQDNFG